MKDFLAMGGYALYVWSSFGLTFIVMAAIILGTRMQRRRIVATVRRKSAIADTELNNQNKDASGQ